MRFSYYLPLRCYFSVLKFFVRQLTRPLSFAKRPSVLGIMLRTYLKRPEWLYYPGVEMDPVKKFTFTPPSGADAAHDRLCERLIAAYHLANKENPPLQSASDLWKGIIKKRYQLLLSALEKGDPKALGQVLATMFQGDFMYGISSGALGLDPGYTPFLRIKMVEELLALAESLGVVRTETPEQGQLGYGMAEGLAGLAQKIERQLGIPIGFPQVGGAYGFQIGERLITAESPEHIYVAGRINEAIANHLQPADQRAPRMVEIGAGFGGTAYWLFQLRKHAVSHYTIIDLPMMNACQGFFLASVFGPEKVRLHGEPLLTAPGIEIIPPHAKERLAQQNFHILINENSMPEMPEAVVREYLAWARTRVSGIFYSYNQEAFSPVNGAPQTLVPKAVADVGNYRRLSRNYSWVRRGYVEEVYLVAR
jgi:hypothetical protein